ncbi:hypothetical protein CCHR01_01320 [Colletotrichum chrysophilum]|uniref:Secreted protein n=2 Tax=Colletotrichum gloeosporioides species complex TaxID=2707338 RepID=A0A8H3ZYT6_9PEZI|nr:hypothetical protein GQ607_001623 [Colletotrichum asianum]KAK1856106.1 hypothetical protein CCHR01_01320 [Colletotrichum chrysophilum]
MFVSTCCATICHCSLICALVTQSSTVAWEASQDARQLRLPWVPWAGGETGWTGRSRETTGAREPQFLRPWTSCILQMIGLQEGRSIRCLSLRCLDR